MTQFAGYAKFYDDMYQNKNYVLESDLIEEVFRRFSPHPVKFILSLGCGTGTYEIELAKRGYQLTGVDLSQDMLNIAQAKIAQDGFKDDIQLVLADIRKLPKFEKTFDAVIMMFNIAGYQRTPADMTQVASGVASALKPGGIFLFDAWNEPAVLADPPSDRTKVIDKPDGTKLTRLTRGSLDRQNKLVKIQFEVTEAKMGNTQADVTEDHPMRYWAIDELKSVLADGGLEFLQATSFANLNQPVSDQEWDMQVIAKKA